jgi:hypothetical protein
MKQESLTSSPELSARCPECGVFRDYLGYTSHFAGCTFGVPNRAAVAPPPPAEPALPNDAIWEELAWSFYDHIAHGDEKHREWLMRETFVWFKARKDRFAAAPSGPPVAEMQPTLTERLRRKCYDWGTYWRAADAHGVVLTHAQAIELLADALGVEVEVGIPSDSSEGKSDGKA